MDSLGSEVGQKMRCAVKAKLIELGTGGSSGYIDDELPDYVMIMVANKRSKSQMISDLNLFLGEHTDVFVIWLHEVLQKLQEVTLPSNVVAKGKRKPGENNEITPVNKKDKKDRKKDKKQKKSADKNVLDNPETPSITDVFVDHLLQKTKQTFPIDTSTVKTKEENSEISTYQNQSNNNETDSFDIPTISEIGANCFSVQSSRERDIAELKDIQKKIYQAKKQLKNFDEHDESEDEDFLNIKEDGEEFDDDVNKFNNIKKNQVKSPIVFEKSAEPFSKEDKNMILEPRKRIIYQQSSIQKRETLGQYDNNTTQKLEKEKSVEKSVYKKSVHERLGLKIQRPSLLSEQNNSLKRKDIEHAYEENKLKERKIESPKDTKQRLDKRKLVSKIIVAKSKPNINNRLSDIELDQSENENRDNVKSVNSVIKIKPRPTVSPSRQACKNLLLRAVAEAQKSTTVVPNLRRNENINQQYVSNKVSSTSRSQKLYSNSFRNRNRKNLLEHVKKDNIVIEVNSDNFSPTDKYNYEHDDEYIPEPISDKGDSESEHIYIPKTIMTEISNNESNKQEPKESKTQFVVTLDEKTGEKYISRNKNSKQIKEKRKISDGKIQIIKDIVSSNSKKCVNLDELTTDKTDKLKNHKKISDLKKVSARKMSVDTEFESITLNKNKGKDESKHKTLTPPLPSSVENLEPSPKKRKRISVSPIKFDLNEIKNDDITNEKMQTEEKTKIIIKKSEYLKKYDRIPELLSNIAINRPSVKAKLKERCKYFPSCTNSECEYFHPSGQCKAFPNCKFADNCLYIHPKCKFDLTCNRNGCNFSHTTATVTAAPPLSSHVVPVQNYKTITANPITPTMCKYYPNCSNTQCTFFHPKACRFGRNCMNKNECNFYHHEIPSSNKFKWIATSA